MAINSKDWIVEVEYDDWVCYFDPKTDRRFVVNSEMEVEEVKLVATLPYINFDGDYVHPKTGEIMNDVVELLNMRECYYGGENFEGTAYLYYDLAKDE